MDPRAPSSPPQAMMRQSDLHGDMQQRQIKSQRANKMGKERMINLLESRIGNAERTFQNNLSNDCYSNGKPN